MSTSRKHTRRVARRAAFLMAGGLLAFALPSSASAEDVTTNPNQFELFAKANVMKGYAASRSVPVVQAVEFGPFGASAAASSSGVVKADAGLPYSPFVYSLPSTASGVIGNGVTVPTPPGYVAATFPGNPESSDTEVPYQLLATTTAQSAKGQVTISPSAAGDLVPKSGFAQATSVANPDGSVTVRAVSRVDSFSYAGLVELSRIAVDYSMTIQPSGAASLTGTLRLGTITVIGQTTGLTQDGATAAGMALPVTPQTLNTLSPALKALGLTISYAPTRFGYADGSSSAGSAPIKGKTLQSVDFGGLVIGGKGTIPGQGDADITTTLADVSLSATNVIDSSAFSPTPDGNGPGTPVNSGPTVSNVTGAPSSPVSKGADPVLAGSTDVGGSPSVGAPQTAAPVVTAPRLVRVAEPAVSTRSFYLVLVLAAGLALGSSQLVRLLAVRRAARTRTALVGSLS